MRTHVNKYQTCCITVDGSTALYYSPGIPGLDVASPPNQLGTVVSLINDAGFDRQQSDVSLYGATVDGLEDDIETDGGYMDVEGTRPGRFESDVSLITDTGFDRQRQQSEGSLIANTGFVVATLESDDVEL